MSLFRTVVLIGFFTILLAGCSSTQAPRISIVDASVSEATDEAVVVSFLLKLENPNNQPLPLRDFEYSLSVDGKQVFQGRRSVEATLQQEADYTLLLPAVVPFRRLGGTTSGIHSCVVSGQLSYVAPGQLAEVLTDLRWPAPTTNFSGAAQVEFSSP